MKDVKVRMKNAWRLRVRAGVELALAALREIFDENAYSRFLHRHNLKHSRNSYRAFVRENAGRRERRARCC